MRFPICGGQNGGVCRFGKLEDTDSVAKNNEIKVHSLRLGKSGNRAQVFSGTGPVL